jgi:hypothetical protein
MTTIRTVTATRLEALLVPAHMTLANVVRLNLYTTTSTSCSSTGHVFLPVSELIVAL